MAVGKASLSRVAKAAATETAATETVAAKAEEKTVKEERTVRKASKKNFFAVGDVLPEYLL